MGGLVLLLQQSRTPALWAAPQGLAGGWLWPWVLGTFPAAILSVLAGTPASSQNELGLPGCSKRYAHLGSKVDALCTTAEKHDREQGWLAG